MNTFLSNLAHVLTFAEKGHVIVDKLKLRQRLLQTETKFLIIWCIFGTKRGGTIFKNR